MLKRSIALLLALLLVLSFSTVAMANGAVIRADEDEGVEWEPGEDGDLFVSDQANHDVVDNPINVAGD